MKCSMILWHLSTDSPSNNVSNAFRVYADSDYLLPNLLFSSALKEKKKLVCSAFHRIIGLRQCSLPPYH